MRPALKVLHLIGFAAFVGTVFVHVLVSVLADPTAAGAYAELMALKDTSTRALILPGVVILGVSGALLARRGRRPWPLWLRIKVGLVPLLAINGVFVLLPVGAAIAEAAALGAVPAALLLREEVAGAINIALILAVIALSAARPQRAERAS